jgi:hypothetical protein
MTSLEADMVVFYYLPLDIRIQFKHFPYPSHWTSPVLTETLSFLAESL